MTQRKSSPYKATVLASCRGELESQLSRAVQDGIAAALKCKTGGLLITRLDYTTFTVEVGHDIPFGITLERDQLHGPGE